MDLVSVVIPTFNSERTLDRCLKSIFSQTHKDIECLIIDNFSSDGTLRTAKKYPAKVIQVNGERTKAKNAGIENASGKYLFFIDSDMELEPKVIEECIKLIGSNDGGITVPERSIGKSFWVKVRDFERSFYEGSAIESARFFKTKLVRQVGGFDEKIIFFEESVVPEKIRKLGFLLEKRTTAAILHIEEDFNMKKWLKKKYDYGKTAGKGKTTSVFYRLGLFFGKGRFYANPVLAFGVLILKFLELLATVAGKIA